MWGDGESGVSVGTEAAAAQGLLLPGYQTPSRAQGCEHDTGSQGTGEASGTSSSRRACHARED